MAVAILIVQMLPRLNMFTVNMTRSAPIGIYIQVPEEKAGYVTLCLRRDHAVYAFYGSICHPGAMDKPRLIKSITERREDGTLIVQGISPLAIDSDILGPIQRSQIDRWWKPFLVLG